MRFTCVLLLLALCGTPVEAAENLAGRVSVIDGDTFDLHGQRIRLHGVDAPESRQTCQDRSGAAYRCGQRSAVALAEHLGTATITCRPVDRDIYGRTVAKCAKGGGDIGAWLVTNGHAVAYREYGTDYDREEQTAKAAGRGVWEGKFTPPAVFRTAQRAPRASTPAAQAAPAGCAIKGNQTARGECIYHVPGSRFYAETVVSPAKGEKYYCSVAEASAAGCRAPR